MHKHRLALFAVLAGPHLADCGTWGSASERLDRSGAYNVPPSSASDPMYLLLDDLPGVEQVELDSAGDVGDAGLAGLAGGEVAGFPGFPRAGAVRAVAASGRRARVAWGDGWRR